jgi:hypothetical protein
MATAETRASYQYSAYVLKDGVRGALVGASDNLQVLATLAGSYFTAQQIKSMSVGKGIGIYNLSGVQIAWISFETE